MKKVRVRHATLLGKADIGIPETMLPAMSRQENSCHYGVLGGGFASRRGTERFVFREKANSLLIHIGQ